MRHEASYAIVEGKALTLSIVPFQYATLPAIYRALNCGDLAATLADPSKLLERIAELFDPARCQAYSQIDLSKLPHTFAKKLYGRDREMADLFTAWDNAKTKIFAFDAMGGAGKTALVYHFVQALKASGWRGARSIFAWSFYSQGSNEDRQTSADDFFKAAYKHFSADKLEPPRDPHQKGVDLAHLVQAQRSLLILDGLEPLQYAAGRTGGGTTSVGIVGGVKDPGVKALLNLLADNNPGLCVVTTRIKLAELRDAHGVVFEPLDRLPLMAGIELLRDLGVEPGTPPEEYQLPQREEFQSLVPAYSPPAAYTPPPADARPALLVDYEGTDRGRGGAERPYRPGPDADRANPLPRTITATSARPAIFRVSPTSIPATRHATPIASCAASRSALPCKSRHSAAARLSLRRPLRDGNWHCSLPRLFRLPGGCGASSCRLPPRRGGLPSAGRAGP